MKTNFIDDILTTESSRGLAAGLFAHFVWGFLVLYWQLLGDLSAIDLLSQRMIWAFVTMLFILFFTKRFNEVLIALKNKKVLLTLLASSMILSVNWGMFLWAILSGHLVDASLGYFITPLLNVLTGKIFFKERLSSGQKAAIVVATCGLIGGIIAYGHFPWLGLALAVTFATYGFIKKSAQVEAAPALCIESGFASIYALIWIFTTSPATFGGFLGSGIEHSLLVLCCGLLTAVPLLSFSYATRHISLASIGILQYLSPSINFVLAITVMGETIKSSDLVVFPLVWFALVIYSIDTVNTMRKLKKFSKKA